MPPETRITEQGAPKRRTSKRKRLPLYRIAHSDPPGALPDWIEEALISLNTWFVTGSQANQGNYLINKELEA
jgi:hypothetical protein